MEPADHLDDLEAFSNVIGTVYDAILDPALWPAALHKVSRYVGAYSSSIISVDLPSRGEILLDDQVIEPHYKELYFRDYIKLDPFVVPRFFVAPGEVVANSDIMSFEEIRRSRIYREWAQPQGLLDCMCATLERTASCFAMVAVLLHEADGPSDAAKKHRMRLLVPHLRRAVLIGNIVDLRRSQAATFEAALDGFSAGIFLVDAKGGLRHANAAGRAMLARNGALRGPGPRLSTGDAKTDRSLRDALAAAGRGDHAMGVRGISIPLAAFEGAQQVAHVLPLENGGRNRTARIFGAAAAVFVQSSALDLVAPPVAIAQAFGLTVAETRVLVAIVDLGGVPRVADALGLAASTVKVHLKKIYRKTGAARQADLVKLVAGFSSPFGAPAEPAPDEAADKSVGRSQPSPETGSLQKRL